MGDNGDDTGCSGRETPNMPYTRSKSNPEQNHSIYEPSRADSLTIHRRWKHAYGEDKLEYKEENDKLWEMLNEIAEEDRILRNEIELLLEKQQQQQQEKLEKLEKQQQQQKVMNDNFRGQPCSKPGGKSRRVFRKNTKITRRRNKKSNRSRSRSHHRHHHHHHRRRRTSHIAKQT